MGVGEGGGWLGGGNGERQLRQKLRDVAFSVGMLRIEGGGRDLSGFMFLNMRKPLQKVRQRKKSNHFES